MREELERGYRQFTMKTWKELQLQIGQQKIPAVAIELPFLLTMTIFFFYKKLWLLESPYKIRSEQFPQQSTVYLNLMNSGANSRTYQDDHILKIATQTCGSGTTGSHSSIL